MSPLIHNGDQFWTLHETPAQRKQQARILRAIYALCDPNGWDARKLAQRAPAAAKRDVKDATKSLAHSR